MPIRTPRSIAEVSWAGKRAGGLAATKTAAKKGAAKPLNTEQKKEMQANPETRHGAGHFN